MAKWSFRTVTGSASEGSAGKWYWRAMMRPTAVFTSAQLFSTIDECAADARSYGFRGSVVPVGDSLCHPLMLGSNEFAGGPRANVTELASAIWV